MAAPEAAGLFDTHCHLDQEPLYSSVEAALRRAQEAGVRQCLTLGTSVESSRSAVALAQRFPQIVRAAVGVHPHEAAAVDERALAQIERLAGDPLVVAIGEVGLDNHRPLSAASEAKQREALEGFLAIARRRSLPVAIHCRDAYESLLALLGRSASRPLRGLLHCASGPPEFIQEALSLGLHVSFAGNVTFPKADSLRALVRLVPDERLLIETDAPFLAPQPLRGRANEPAYVAHTAACLAQLRGTTVEALAALTSRNARNLFAFAPSPSDLR